MFLFLGVALQICNHFALMERSAYGAFSRSFLGNRVDVNTVYIDIIPSVVVRFVDV